MGDTYAARTHEERHQTHHLGEQLAYEHTFQTLARDNHVPHPWQQLSPGFSHEGEASFARRPARVTSSLRVRP